MSRMGKTEEDWNRLKLGFLKTVQRVLMGLADRRKTAKNLADSRKNWKILTVSRK